MHTKNWPLDLHIFIPDPMALQANHFSGLRQNLRSSLKLTRELFTAPVVTGISHKPWMTILTIIENNPNVLKILHRICGWLSLIRQLNMEERKKKLWRRNFSSTGTYTTTSHRLHSEDLNVLHAFRSNWILKCPSMASSCMNSFLVQSKNSSDKIWELPCNSWYCISCSMLGVHPLPHALHNLITTRSASIRPV